MSQVNTNMRETYILGRETRQWGVGVEVCPSLAGRRILHTGWGQIGEGYEIVRPCPTFSHINVCWHGEGELFVGGRWQQFREGMAAIFPAGITHGGRSLEGTPWGICWVCFEEPPGGPRAIAGRCSTLLAADPRALQAAVTGLYREVSGQAVGTIVHHWIELVHLYADRITRHTVRDERLWHLWEQVDADLAAPWTASRLAELAGMSQVHLRRLCHTELGRSPMQHVTGLRLKRAAYLLQSTPQTLVAIARAVGYESAFALSHAFKRAFGVSPKQYRDRAGKEPRMPR